MDRAGRVVWYSPLRFDAPSVFACLLDEAAGHWRLAPSGALTATEREYAQDSLVLRTELTTAEGAVALTEFLALQPGARGHELGKQTPHTLVRIVEGVRGRVPMELEMAPRFEYGLTAARPRVEGRRAEMATGPLALRLTGEVPLDAAGGRVTARFELGAGESLAFALAAWDPYLGGPPPDPEPRKLRDETLATWRSWAGEHTGYDGVARPLVRRSATVLQGLTDARTGAVLAAATTSLPEAVGGTANWDYRYAWLRDLAFVMRALWVAACPTEANRFLGFLAASLGQLEDRPVPIVLGADGRRDLSEHELPHLGGYLGSRPVRIGNAAWQQRQLDVLGEVLDSAYLLRDSQGVLDDATSELLVAFADRAARDWRTPDAGMWEARDQERDYTSSKVMCWVALDRAIRLAGRLGPDLPVDRWRRERAAVREAILERAWSSRTSAYAGAFDSDDLDASVLLMPLVGFLPADDPRMAATIDAVATRLTSGPLVHRWDGDTNGFVLCSYWLVECLALGGQRHRALQRFEELRSCANDLGLLTEMSDPVSGEPVGNVPQAFSHVGLINAAWCLTPHGADPEETEAS